MRRQPGDSSLLALLRDPVPPQRTGVRSIVTVITAGHHQQLLDAILAKDEAAAVKHVRDIISQGICVVEAPYESER